MKLQRLIAGAVILSGISFGVAMAQDETPQDAAPQEDLKLTPSGNTATAIQQEAPEDKNQVEVNVGKIDLSDPAVFDKGHPLILKIGKRTNTQMKVYRDQMDNKESVNMDVRFQAGGTEKVNLGYYVVFQNASGSIIGAGGGSGEVEPGVDDGWKDGVVITLPRNRFSEIVYYQIVLYESDKPIGELSDDTAPETKPEPTTGTDANTDTNAEPSTDTNTDTTTDDNSDTGTTTEDTGETSSEDQAN